MFLEPHQITATHIHVCWLRQVTELDMSTKLQHRRLGCGFHVGLFIHSDFSVVTWALRALECKVKWDGLGLLRQ